VLVIAGALNAGATAGAALPATIHAVTELPPDVVAVGLYVPGAGGTISREATVASLERGKVENALLGGKPGGRIQARITTGPATGPAVYVTLPPAGSHSNTKRYLVGVAAPGYRSGILTADSTRIDGLVSIPDITQTAVALARGTEPDIRVVSGSREDLTRLDQRLRHVHHVRGWTLTVVALALLGLALVLPRAGVVFGASAVTVALWLEWTGTTRFWEVLVWMALVPAAVAYLVTLRLRWVPYAVAAFFAAFLLVLALRPEVHALAVLGARPDGGGRFYGIGNQVETLLLPPLLAATVIGGLRWLPPLGALALVTVAWSKAGADGGGLLVYAAALAVLLLRLSAARMTWRRAVLAGACVIALAFAMVGLDAALGGSSHVTHAVGGGPGSLFGDFAHRLHISWASATKSKYNIVLFLSSAAMLVWIGTRTPRRVAVDAMLVALAVSLLVNDTPVDVIGLGALGCLALFRFDPVDSRPMRRGAALTAVCAAAALVAAGCGSQGVTTPTPQTVVGTVKAEAPGKAIFTAQGCGACHTYTPAGPDAKGQIGPDLDKLADYAKQANQPLKIFVTQSIVDPNKFVGKQCPPSGTAPCPKNVMPKSYASLPANDLKDLVDFLTTPQG
jgi:cytochrome c551/c552